MPSKYPINENLRVTFNDDSEGDHALITNNGKYFIASSDGVSAGVIWNNIVGCNSSNSNDHLNYLSFMKNTNGLEPGNISYSVNSTVIREHSIE